MAGSTSIYKQLTAAEQELEWRACEYSCEYFLRNYWHIQGERGVQLFELRPYQVEMLGMWLEEKYSLHLKARQEGASTLASALVTWEAFFQPDQLIIMLSKTKDDAVDLLGKSQLGYELMPEWMKQRGPRKLSNNKLFMEFENRSRVVSQASSSNPARGRTPTRVVADELAFFRNDKEAWAAIEPAVEIRGKFTALSTANGVGNLFHELWIKGTTGVDDRFATSFNGWDVVPGRNEEWYRKQTERLPRWQLAQEFPSSAEEAFVQSGMPVFDQEVLNKFKLMVPVRQCRISVEDDSWGVYDDVQGRLRIWEMPKSGCKYVIGADVSEGLEHGDYSVAQVLDENGVQVAKWRGHCDPDLFGSQVLFPLGMFYNRALMIPEVNNHGFATVLALVRASYPHMYFRKEGWDQHSQDTTARYGWRTNYQTKSVAIDDLIRHLRDGGVQVVDPETLGELRTYSRDDRGRMSGQPFDDQVMALAIAAQGLQHMWSPEYKADEAPRNSWAWLKQQSAAKRRQGLQQGWRLGSSRRFGTLGA